MFYVLKRHTNENQNKFLELKNELWEKVNLIMKSQKSLKLNRYAYRENRQCNYLLLNNEKDYEITKSKSNICFSPGIIEFYYPIICRFIPLWSGKI